MMLPGSARSMTCTHQVRVIGYPALDRGVEVPVETPGVGYAHTGRRGQRSRAPRR